MAAVAAGGTFAERAHAMAEAINHGSRPGSGLSLRQPVLVGAAIIALYGLARALTEVRRYIALAFFAIVLAALLTYPIDLLARWMRRSFATVITLLLFVGIVAGCGLLIVPTIIDQGTHLVQELPGTLVAVANRLPHGRVADLVRSAGMNEVRNLLSYAAPLALGAGHALIESFVVVVLAFFFAAHPRGYFGAALTVVPREHEPVFREWWARTGRILRRWVAGALVAMAIMGTVTAVGLLIIGVDNWLLLGFLTFLGTLVPYLGALASAIPALLIAWAASPTTFLWVLGLYIVVHHIEGYLVQPFIMRRAVQLRPAVLLVWQIIMAGLFGIIGIFVATPALAVLKATVNYLYVERRLGKRPGD